MTTSPALAPKPPWIKTRLPSGPVFRNLNSMARGLGLHTVCEEALCPNLHECWGGGTATFMILGDTCTRGCKFCAVATGNPRRALDETEPERVAEAVRRMGLSYVVITSVDRDDLADGGASVFARTVAAIKRAAPAVLVETLMPDFRGDRAAIRAMAFSGAEVLAHNVETVERLTPRVRDPRATYRQSLDVLSALKVEAPDRFTKSSVMLGLGETDAEVERTLLDLRAVGCEFLTLGQYLKPTARHLDVAEYVRPEVFEGWGRRAEAMGFRYAASGPLVRSSYRAGEFYLMSAIPSKSPTFGIRS